MYTATTEQPAPGLSSDEPQREGPAAPLRNLDPERLETLYWIKEISNGNFEAQKVMCAFWDFNHMIDDLYDRDKPVTMEDIGRILATFVGELSLNPFWREWSWHLMPLYLSCINRWLDGEDWPDKRQAAVIRCGDVDFMLQFAYCTGGWDHLRAMRAARTYDKED